MNPATLCCSLLALFSVTAYAKYAPLGYFDGIIRSQTAYGWALDPNNANRQITVHFYVDGPAGQGRMAGSVIANQPRSDVN